MTQTMSDPQKTTHEGQDIAYNTYGDPTGEDVLVLHGTPGSRLIGGLFDEAAAEAGIRIISPDRPGFGESASRSDWGPAEAPAALGAVLADAGAGRVPVIAFSNGAPFALSMATAQPTPVSELHLISASSPPTLEGAPPRPLRLLGKLARRAPPMASGLYRFQGWLASRYPDRAAEQLTNDGREVPDEIAKQVGREIAAGLAGRPRGAVAETRLFADPWTVDLDAVDVPVALYHGTADDNAPIAGARAMADRLPNGELHELEGADHLRTLTQSRRRILADLDS